MKQIDLREGARRQHRVVALFAVVQCWLRGIEGVAFQRRQLERLLGLVRFKETRVQWMQADFKEFFPHQQVYKFSKKPNSLASLVVCRAPFVAFLPKGTMSTANRIADATGRPKLGLFELWNEPEEELNDAFEGLLPFFADKANFDERFLASYLALLGQGQISPKNLPRWQAPEPDDE